MDKLPPIPTPASQRWRAFRIQVLPLVIFAGVFLSVALLWKSLVATTGIDGKAGQANVISQSNRVAAAPILVSMPDGVKLVPGESVDLSTKPAKP